MGLLIFPDNQSANVITHEMDYHEPLNFHRGFSRSNYLEKLKSIDPFQTNTLLSKNLIFSNFGILSVFPDIMSTRVIIYERKETFSEQTS